MLALADINPVGAEGGLCLELSSGSKQAHLAKGLTLKEIPGTTKARRAPFQGNRKEEALEELRSIRKTGWRSRVCERKEKSRKGREKSFVEAGEKKNRDRQLSRVSKLLAEPKRQMKHK